MRRDLLAPLKRLARRRLPVPVAAIARRLWRGGSALDPRRLRRRAAYRRQNVSAAAEEIVLGSHLRLAIDPRSREPFEWYGFGSLEAAAELDAFLAWMEGRYHLLDVGASHGLFSLAFTRGRATARALAVEPSPPAFEVLEANLARNPACEVVPLRVAAGASPGEIRMRQVWYHLEALAPDGDEPGALVLPVRPLDNLCKEHGFMPDLIKVDVEGYELAVLEGCRDLLAALQPPVFLEVHPAHLTAHGRSVTELFALLEAVGYHPCTYRGADLDRDRLARLDSVFHVLCLAKPERDRRRTATG